MQECGLAHSNRHASVTSLKLPHLQYLGEVKVVQCDHWRDASGLQLLEEAGVKLQCGWVGRRAAASSRQDP